MKNTKPTIIVISGLPGAGKTTLGHNLAEFMHLPFLAKDEIREILFNHFGDDSKNMPMIRDATYEILYSTIKKIVAAGKSVIIESNFEEKFATPQLQSLKDEFNCSLFQIFCSVEARIAFARFQKRSQDGNRHHLHATHNTFEEYKKSLIDNREYHLSLPGIAVDMTKPESISIAEVAAKIGHF